MAYRSLGRKTRDRRAAALWREKRDAAQQATAHCLHVIELCQAAGRVDLAAQFIAGCKSLAYIRAALEAPNEGTNS